MFSDRDRELLEQMVPHTRLVIPQDVADELGIGRKTTAGEMLIRLRDKAEVKLIVEEETTDF